MSRLKLAPAASRDLDEIWAAAAAKEGAEFASAVTDDISDRFPMLATMPEGGRLRPELEPGLRSFPAGDYIIYYRKAKRGGIQISRIVHGMRDQLKALKGPRRGALR